jgi:transposase
MDFREATEYLYAGVSPQELAKALGVSVATVRQARLRPDAKAHRSPPGAGKRRKGAWQRSDHPNTYSQR